MTLRTLILRSLRFHWRSHLGVVLGTSVGSAALIGALIVGDSVKGSLRERALERLGWVETAMNGSDRLFTQKLAERVIPINRAAPSALNSWNFDAVLKLPGTASRQDGTARANQVNVFGVGYWSFWQPNRITNGRPAFALIPKGTVVLNEALAAQLHAQPGDEIVLRLHKPTALASDVPISPKSDTSIALRLKVHGIATAPYLGNFSLRAGQTPPLNAFLLINDLAPAAGLPGKANLLLAGDFRTYRPTFDFQLRSWWDRIRSHLPGYAPVSRRIATEAIKLKDWRLAWQPTLADLSLDLRALTNQPMLELRSSRIFLEPAVEAAVFIPTTNRPSANDIPWWAESRGVRPPSPTNAISDQLLASLAQPVLTYLVNLLRAGTNATPYSMVTAAGPPWTPPGMRDDEILVNQWLADDLRVKPGDKIEMSYFLPESGAALREATNTFRVRAVVPMESPWADRTLMPEFPGIEKAESTADWDTAFPLVHKIRPQDEAYWKQFRGTPRAFVTLAAGQKMWGNRFGNLTAIRFSAPTNGVITVADHRAALEPKILSSLRPEDLGLRFEPVREQALESAAQSQDFGGLFLGFSFFLIAAALLLLALLFQFGVEQRTAEIGTLLALGFTPKQVRRLWLAEGAALAFIGGVLGTVGGLAYARAMLLGLTTVWADAVGGSALHFFVTPQSLVLGLVSSILVAVLTIWLTLRKLARRPDRELLAGEVSDGRRMAGGRMTGEKWFPLEPLSKLFGSLFGCLLSGAGAPPAEVLRAPSPAGPDCNRDGCRTTAAGTAAPLQSEPLSPAILLSSRFRIPVLPALALAAALALAVVALAKSDTANAGVFFGAGVLVLGAGLGFVNAWLTRLSGSPSSVSRPPSSLSLALGGLTRRRSRSVATVALLACGSFLIASIGVFRLDANRDATRRDSGTGGFALLGEATLPIVQDLNTKAGRDFLALSDRDLAGVHFAQFRVHEGDEASCLNLNRAQKPRLLGVKPETLEGRFTVAKGGGWSALRAVVGQASRLSPSSISTEKSETGATPVLPEIPAIGDAASIQWAMGKKVGDTIDYVDERGQPFKVRIVGALANSILQGSLVMDEAELLKRFPGESGYRFFLLDAPTHRAAEVAATLTRVLQDYGLEMATAPRRLEQFNAVQNTYLGTFQVLGGLGLLLGSAGLGVVVLRNVLERRGELALLLAVGWRRRAVQRLVLTEHAVLLALGLGIGVVAAAVAVLPALLSPGAQLPWATLLPTLAGVLAVGALATWLATRWALRGNLLTALRNE